MSRCCVQMGCDQAQGYFYSRPLKLVDMQNFSIRNLHENPLRKPVTSHKPDSHQIDLRCSFDGTGLKRSWSDTQ